MTFLLQTANASIHLVNRTRNGHPSSSHKMNYEIIFCYVIGFLAFASNVLLCLVFGKKRSLLQKRYNIIILTLGIFDLLTGVVLVILAMPTLFLTASDSRTNIFWRILVEQSWLEFTFGKVSMLLIMCLALERWFAVLRPILYRNKFTKRRVYIYIILILIAATTCKIHELFPDYDPRRTISRILVIVEVALTTFLPLSVTWITYIQLWYHHRKSSTVHPKRSRKVKRKLLRMSALTAIFITICWLPAEIEFLIDSAIAVSQEENKSNQLYSALFLLAMSNSVVNPWVYYFTNNEYKTEFRRLFRDFGACFKIHKNAVTKL